MTETDKQYCIKPGYVANLHNRTLERDGVIFWGAQRVASSFDYQWHVYEYAQRLLLARGLRSVIDVGCGPGRKLMHFLAPHASVTGVDQESAISYCRRTYSSGVFLVDNLEHSTLDPMPLADLVIASDVIEHLDNPDVLLEYVRSCSHPNTLILFSTPDRDRARGRSCNRCEKAEHVREWNFEEFGKYITTSGFEVIEHFHLPPLRTSLSIRCLMHLMMQWGRGLPYRFSQAMLVRAV